MRFEARVVGRANIAADQRVVLDHARLRGENYSGRELVQFCTVGCHLERCRFDKVRIHDAQFGSGREPSEFTDCTFDGAYLQGVGGYSRFVRCSFRDVDLRNWLCFAVELVSCTFSGVLRKAIFNGRVRDQDRALLRREQNEIQDNDFSSLEMKDVTFRTGVDLTRQRLPTGAEYLYLPDAATALERAHADIVRWQS